MSNLPNAHSREEILLKAIAESQAIDSPDPKSRVEIYLKQIMENGSISPEEIQAAVDAYLAEHPLDMDASLVDPLKAAPAGVVGERLSELKGDIADGKEAIADLADKKITKFYASNLGETTLADSDNGKIQDMVVFGKSERFQGDIELEDGTTVSVPNPAYPQEIKSVVNPIVKVCGKNLLAGVTFINGYLKSDGSGDIYYTTESSNTICIKEYIPLGNAKSIYWYAENIHNSSEEISSYYADRLYFYDEGKKPILYISKLSLTEPTIISVPDGAKYFRASYDASNKNRMICISSEPVEYEFEKYMSVSLPYTLNAIPVESGGNVTIDGQEYIADYVDVERGKLVRMVGAITEVNTNIRDSSGLLFAIKNISNMLSNPYGKRSNVLCSKYESKGLENTRQSDYAITSFGTSIYIRNKDAVDSLVDSDIVIMYLYNEPIETDLTPEEIQSFKDIANYYPTTNVMVTSDQLDGYTTFNYPLSMENGWNLIKKQLGDTREYIYDMDLQSAEAYVNSEYAVALAELEV